MGLNSAQPMLHKMSIQRHKISSPPSSPPSLYSPFSYLLFWKLADRYKCAQPIGEIFPTPIYPFPFVAGEDSWLRSWLWDKVSYSQLRHRVPLFFFEYSLWLVQIQSLASPDTIDIGFSPYIHYVQQSYIDKKEEEIELRENLEDLF